MSFVNPFLVATLLTCITTTAQDITIALHSRTPCDLESVSVIVFQPDPPEEVRLPEVSLDGARYLEIFYSWEVEGDEQVTALVLPAADGEHLYIDLNNDEDLTNDGGPTHFPAEQNELIFYLQGTSDPLQRTGRSLQRVPNHAYGDPEATALHVDADGNLSPVWTTHFARRNPGFEGKKGTFYFDDYVDLSRGTADLGGKTYALGLFDFDQDGRFDTVDGSEEHPHRYDRFLIDLGQDGELNEVVTTEVFKLNDVFEVGGQHYRLARVDPYGRSLTLTETDKPATAYYLKVLEDEREVEGGVQRGALEADFWNLQFKTAMGEDIALRDFKGKYVLLNFWGEWCHPCVAEIPALVATREKWPADTLAMIGIIKTKDLGAALQMAAERGMTWPQTPMTRTMEEGFRVVSYPTNILILPDGKTYLHAGHVSTEFFERHVE